MNRIKTKIALSLGTLALLAALAGPAQAQSGAGRVVFSGGKVEHCRMGACPRFDLVRSTTPHGGRRRVLAKVRSVVDMSATEDGRIAVLSKNVAGGGSNSNAFTQIYLISRSGKRSEVFPERLQGFNATAISISADGKLLALAGRSTDFTAGPSKIWIVRSNGTGMHEITSGPGTDETPAFSPDGTQVVFSRTLGAVSRKSELYSVSVTGGDPTRLTFNGIEDVNPVFSPDGLQIAFGQIPRGSQNRIEVMRFNGTGLRPVAGTGAEYPDPDYSPNGRNLVFAGEVRRAPEYMSALYTVRATGGERKLVAGTVGSPAFAQWTLRP